MARKKLRVTPSQAQARRKLYKLSRRYQAAKAAQAPPTPPPEGGTDSFGALGWHVPIEAVEALSAKVTHLGTDIMKMLPPDYEVGMDLKDWSGLKAQQIEFKTDYAGFSTTWAGWVADHYGDLSRTGAEPVQEFENFEKNYNEYLRQYQEDWGGTTTAIKSKEDTDRGAFLEAASALKWVAIAVVGYLAYKSVKT